MLLMVAACSFHPNELPVDGAQRDAGSDSSVPPSMAHRQAETVAGAGRLRAGTITIDVEIGRAVAVKHATAGSITIDGQPVIKP